MSQLITKTETIKQKTKSIRADKVEPGQIVRDFEGHLLIGLAKDVQDRIRESNFLWNDGMDTGLGVPFFNLVDGDDVSTGGLLLLDKSGRVFPVESARLYIKEK